MRTAACAIAIWSLCLIERKWGFDHYLSGMGWVYVFVIAGLILCAWADIQELILRGGN